jgi:N-acetylneuraminate synthase
VDYGRKSSEQGNVQFRRSLYFVNDLPEGAVVTLSDVRSVRPGYGLHPKYLNDLVGKRLNQAVQRNTPIRRAVFMDDL